MRSVIFTLLASLWFSAGPAFSRNGETGILIVIHRFQIQVDAASHRSILICKEEWTHINEIISNGQEAKVQLENYGTYSVEENEDGGLSLHLIEDTSDITYSLLSRECPINSKEDC